MTDEKTALIHIDGKHLGKAATVLIEKVSLAVGGLYRPKQIERVAKAEKVAALMAAETQIEIGDLQRRAAHRWLAEESRKQENMESITDKAIPLLHEAADASKIEDDWVANFFEKSRSVSDADMQSLWSRVLAGEANSPGRFSRRTVNLITDLDKADAILFAKLCGFMWQIGEPVPLVFDLANPIYKAHDITFPALTHLDSLGLITFSGAMSYQSEGLPQNFFINYFGKPLNVQPPKGHSAMQIGKTLFTNAGRQLAEICEAQPVAGFYDLAVEFFGKENTVVPMAGGIPVMPIPPEMVAPDQR